MWDWLVYGALILGFLAVSAALARLAIRVLRAWRAVKPVRRRVAAELDRLAALGDEAAGKAARAADTTRLQAGLDELRVTLARFAVLRAAVDEATDAAARVAAVYPRK
jgi:hypothetical protein